MVEKKIVKKTPTKKTDAKTKAKKTVKISKSKTTKTKSKSKTTKTKSKSKNEPVGDMGIVIVDDDIEIDQEKVNEERRAYLEEARSQEAFD